MVSINARLQLPNNPFPASIDGKIRLGLPFYPTYYRKPEFCTGFVIQRGRLLLCILYKFAVLLSHIFQWFFRNIYKPVSGSEIQAGRNGYTLPNWSQLLTNRCPHKFRIPSFLPVPPVLLHRFIR